MWEVAVKADDTLVDLIGHFETEAEAAEWAANRRLTQARDRQRYRHEQLERMRAALFDEITDDPIEIEKHMLHCLDAVYSYSYEARACEWGERCTAVR